MPSLMLSSRTPFAVSLLIGVGLVAGGITLAQTLHLAACPLCIWQRMLYLALSVAALLGLAADGHRLWRRFAALLMTVSAASGVFVAAYQTYIQRFAQDTQCSGTEAWWESFVDWAGERLPLLFRASGLCSDPGWKMLGLSIAEWSLLAFCFLTALSLYALLRRD
ncbi:disulfide bond formation protein B [mine drainage metagenome]|uniref:Disulfide bond formation protein B n=1 Tax=mine drainage metagenome TaxID=410659 RepID=A0A1J5RMH7_9ZZZZ